MHIYTAIIYFPPTHFQMPSCITFEASLCIPAFSYMESPFSHMKPPYGLYSIGQLVVCKKWKVEVEPETKNAYIF